MPRVTAPEWTDCAYCLIVFYDLTAAPVKSSWVAMGQKNLSQGPSLRSYIFYLVSFILCLMSYVLSLTPLLLFQSLPYLLITRIG